MNGDAPFLSVVIPFHGSAADLELCLAAIAASEYQHFEVLVVDDDSPAPAAPIAERFGFRVLRMTFRSGPAAARNRGAEASRGEWLVFVDADVCVHPGTLSRVASAIASDASVTAFVGTYDDAPRAPGFVSQYRNLLHHYVHLHAHGEAQTFWAGCGAIRRDAFVSVGGFDSRRYGRPCIEDIELGTRLRAKGHRIRFDRSIQCTHLKRWTLFGVLKSDVFDRGIPWTRLMLREGMVDTLNAQRGQRVCVAAAGLAIGLLAMTPLDPVAAPIAIVILAVVAVLNRDLYRYLAARRGLAFMVSAILMHSLYFCYCGLAFIVGSVMHAVEDGEAWGSRRSSLVSPGSTSAP